jgi:16S rRNA (guanine527-N7)-methyltransferase
MRPLQELLSPFVSRPLDAEKLNQLQLYLDLLLKWNARVNLTAVRDAEEIVQRHFGESLFAGEQLELNDASTLIDFGSGAGFPGLPIKIIAPHLHVTLVESQQKKATFMREVIRTLRLENATVHAGRAEESSLKSQIVTVRAVEKFESALPVAASLVEPAGRLALLIGAAQSQIAKDELPTFQWRSAIPIPGSRERVVLAGKARARNSIPFKS